MGRRTLERSPFFPFGAVDFPPQHSLPPSFFPCQPRRPSPLSRHYPSLQHRPPRASFRPVAPQSGRFFRRRPYFRNDYHGRSSHRGGRRSSCAGNEQRHYAGGASEMAWSGGAGWTEHQGSLGDAVVQGQRWIACSPAASRAQADVRSTCPASSAPVRSVPATLRLPTATSQLLERLPSSSSACRWICLSSPSVRLPPCLLSARAFGLSTQRHR